MAEKNNKKENDEDQAFRARGAKDDFEVVKMILEDNPNLRSRVLHKLREIREGRGKADSTSVRVSRKELDELEKEGKSRQN